ncbi:MAG: cytochrome P450, partial [Bacteroidales bacterium]|nr:cytochrome P450 [Bacteroidales bacterium]
GRQGYTAFSYDACAAAFRDTVHFSSSILHRPNERGDKRLGLLEMDGAEHQGFRKALQPMFNKPVAFDWWRRMWIDATVARLIERLKTRDSAELNLDFCARIPVHTITVAIGLSAQQSLAFRAAYMKSSGIGVKSPAEQQQAAAQVESILFELIAKRKEQPRDDLVSNLLAATIKEPGGALRPMTDREVMIHARLALLAGGGTTWRQMGITLLALLTHPDQLQALRADRSLMQRVIDESMRWNATDPVFHRLVIEDAELAGVDIPAGAVLEICLGAANRDPSRWENPDVFDIHRPVRSHLGFGMGSHRCLGLNVAHAEITAGVNALLDAFPNLRLDPARPAPFLTGGLEQRGVSPLHVRLD